MKQQRKRNKKCLAMLMTLAMVISMGTGITLPRQAQAAGYGLSNPVTDSNGVTTWDCVYFGNYYQSDTTGTTKDPIKWRVLSVDGDDAFLMADQNLDAKPYNTSYVDVTWETCTLRSWLNGYGASDNVEGTDYSSDNFLDTAFTAEERAAIRQTTVVNEDNYGTEGGNDTTDQVYLLSIAEASNAEYGFNSEFQTESKTREAKNTAYAKSQGAWTSTSTEYEGNGAWWLRSPGDNSASASGVSTYGYGGYDSVYSGDDVVRPALHLNLSSSPLWSYAGTVSSEGGTVSNGSYVGTLKGYDTSNRTAVVDDRELGVSSKIEDTEVTDLLANHTTRLVAVELKDGVIVKICAAEEILKPTIEIQPEISEIVYENSKFSTKKFDIDLVIKCDVKSSYQLSQVMAAAGENSGLAAAISKVKLDSTFAGSGEIPYYLKEGAFDSKKISYEEELDISLGLGETKKISLKAYLKDDYIPENVSNATMLTAQLNDDSSLSARKTINIANMDKAEKIAQTKQSASVNTAEMNTVNTILNGTQAAFDDTKLREYLTDNEVKAVTAQVNNWIYTSNALNSIITDDSSNGLIQKLLKNAKLSKEDLADKVFEKLGISQAKGMLTVGKEYNGTLKFETTDKNTGKDIVIIFTTKMTFYSFNGNQVSYGGFGTISYKIQKQGFNVKSSKTDLKCEKNGNGVGVITYANYDSFVSSLKKILEKQIHNCYSKLYGKGIDEISDDLLAGTFRKIVVGKYGSASEMVYTGLKTAYTGYTEEDAKKSIKEVTIILAKDLVNKKTKVEAHCPVDISVYDSEGNLCAQVIDNQASDVYDDVPVYVDGDVKYLLLPDEDYIVEYTGNDEGTMTCNVVEYENDEPVRSLTYENISLSKDKKYSNFFEEGRRQGVSLYNLNDEDGNTVTASSGEGFETDEIKAEKISLDKETLVLKVGENSVLNEAFEPYNTTEGQVTWKSSDNQTVTVDENGMVTALKAGTAEVTVKGQDANLSAVCQVTVMEQQSSPSPETSVEPTAKPTKTPVVTPTAKPTKKPAVTPSAKPTKKPVITPSTKPTSAAPSDKPDADASEIPATPEASNAPESAAPSPAASASTQPSPLSSARPGGTTSPSAGTRMTAAPGAKVSPSTVPAKAQTPRKGQVFKDVKTKAYYKILSVTAKGGKVAYLRPAGQKAGKVTIKASVTWRGRKFQVTQIGNKAFKNYKKLQKVTIGRNVSVIGKKTFAGCKSLKLVILTDPKQKLPKNAFVGCPRKPKVRKDF